MKYAIRIFLFLVVSVGFISCDEVDLDGNEAGNVFGTWQVRATSGNNTFVLISETEFNFYEYNASLNCVVSDIHSVIMPLDQGFIQVQKGSISPLKVYALSADEDRLQLRRIDESVDDLRRLIKTDPDFNVNSIPNCNTGKWEFVAANNNEGTFVEITDFTIQVYSEFSSEECFESVTYFIDGIDGNIYKLIDNITEDFTSELFVQIKRTQSGLEITLEDEGGTITDIYTTSSADFSALSPDCGNSIPNQFLGFWQIEQNDTNTQQNSFLEIKPDTVVNWQFIQDDINECYNLSQYVSEARRGDTFFMTSLSSDVIDRIYQFIFDQDVLITRTDDGISVTEERYIVSPILQADLSSLICTNNN